MVLAEPDLMNGWYADLIVHLFVIIGILALFLASVVVTVHVGEAAAASARVRRVQSEPRGFEVVRRGTDQG